LSTLFIRLAPRADGEGALAHYALVAANGSMVEQGERALRGMGALVAGSRRVLLLLAATDVTLLNLKVPPLSAARLKAALPGLVEEHVLGDPADCVLAPAPMAAADGLRAVAVVQRAWFEPLVRSLLAQGARKVVALPAQLCLPLLAGRVSGAIGGADLCLRLGPYQGLGLAFDGTPAQALQSARALAGAAPLTLYVAPAVLDDYQALAQAQASDAEPSILIEADHWQHWIAGAAATTLDLVPALGAAGAQARNWQRWRWPLGLAALAVIVNLAGLNIEWLRMKHEGEAVRLSMLQTFKAAYPKETVILDPQAQMRKNNALAKANAGQAAADEFTSVVAAFGEAARAGAAPVIASLEYRERALTVKLKPGGADAAQLGAIRTALAARKLNLTEAAPGTWLIRSAGGTQ
jgi:general secretion pathway protein L